MLHRAKFPDGWRYRGEAGSPSNSAQVMHNINEGYFRARVHVS